MQFSSGLLGMLTLDTSRHVGQLSGAGLKRAAVRHSAQKVWPLLQAVRGFSKRLKQIAHVKLSTSAAAPSTSLGSI